MKAVYSVVLLPLVLGIKFSLVQQTTGEIQFRGEASDLDAYRREVDTARIDVAKHRRIVEDISRERDLTRRLVRDEDRIRRSRTDEDRRKDERSSMRDLNIRSDMRNIGDRQDERQHRRQDADERRLLTRTREVDDVNRNVRATPGGERRSVERMAPAAESRRERLAERGERRESSAGERRHEVVGDENRRRVRSVEARDRREMMSINRRVDVSNGDLTRREDHRVTRKRESISVDERREDRAVETNRRHLAERRDSLRLDTERLERQVRAEERRDQLEVRDSARDRRGSSASIRSSSSLERNRERDLSSSSASRRHAAINSVDQERRRRESVADNRRQTSERRTMSEERQLRRVVSRSMRDTEMGSVNRRDLTDRRQLERSEQRLGTNRARLSDNQERRDRRFDAIRSRNDNNNNRESIVIRDRENLRTERSVHRINNRGSSDERNAESSNNRRELMGESRDHQRDSTRITEQERRVADGDNNDRRVKNERVVINSRRILDNKKRYSSGINRDSRQQDDTERRIDSRRLNRVEAAERRIINAGFRSADQRRENRRTTIREVDSSMMMRDAERRMDRTTRTMTRERASMDDRRFDSTREDIRLAKMLFRDDDKKTRVRLGDKNLASTRLPEIKQERHEEKRMMAITDYNLGSTKGQVGSDDPSRWSTLLAGGTTAICGIIMWMTNNGPASKLPIPAGM